MRATAAAAVLLTVVALGGCAQEPLPEPQPQEDAAPLPVVAEGQLDSVMQAVVDQLAAADAALDPALLPPRVTGPAAELRTAGYTVRRALPDKGVVTPVGVERLVDVVPQEQEWPRTVMTVTRAAADDPVPELVLLTQAGPRDPYTLAAWATLLPGVTMPEVAPASEGVTVPATEEAGELATAPTDVVAQYADVLTNGAASQYAPAFAPDLFSAQVLAEQDAERQSVTVACPACFTYSVAHAPRAGNVWAVGTEDGGAIVMAVLDSTRSLAVAAAGAKLPLVDDLAVLAGKPEALATASFTSVEVVAFRVPPADSTDRVQVLGSERALTAASAT